MKTYNVSWATTERTTAAGESTLFANTTDMTLQEVCDLAVEHDARATLRDDTGRKVGEVSPSGTWSFC